MGNNRIIVLGSRGFVGSNLIKHLSNNFTIYSPNSKEVNLTERKTLSNKFMPGDIIINSAGYSRSSDLSDEGKKKFQSVNVEGLKNLVEAAINAEAKQLIHISSVASMGIIHEMGITENMQESLKTPYANSKFDGEKILNQYKDRLAITILRPTLVFGNDSGLTQYLCKIIQKGVLPLPGKGEAYIPVTYIENVAYAVEICINNSNCFGKTFIIGDENSYKLKDIVQIIAKNLNKKPLTIRIPSWVALVMIMIMRKIGNPNGLKFADRIELLSKSVSYSINYFKSVTNYNQPFSLEQSLKKVSDNYVIHN
jgi:nucleoside-diphosphate-sugar epimerase